VRDAVFSFPSFMLCVMGRRKRACEFVVGAAILMAMYSGKMLIVNWMGMGCGIEDIVVACFPGKGEASTLKMGCSQTLPFAKLVSQKYHIISILLPTPCSPCPDFCYQVHTIHFFGWVTDYERHPCEFCGAWGWIAHRRC
jgi:hypothetical protein